MLFMEAMNCMSAGYCVRRPTWGSGKLITLLKSDDFMVMPTLGIYLIDTPTDVTRKYGSCSIRRGWQPRIADFMATDWVVVMLTFYVFQPEQHILDHLDMRSLFKDLMNK